MGHKIRKTYNNIKQLANDPARKKTWQSVVGIAVFVLFVFSSLLVNRIVQAVNQSAGNYGYYGGTYGYNTSTTSSDAAPAAPGSLTCSASNSGNATCTWAAPTLTNTGTAIATGSGSVSSYTFVSSTSSVSSCSGGTTGLTTTSQSLSSLTASTTYYVAVCAVDNNANTGSVATTSFATPANPGAGGGGGGGGGGATPATPATPAIPATPATPGETPAIPATPATPATPAIPATPPSVDVVKDAGTLTQTLGVSRNTAAEATNNTKVENSAKEFKVALDAVSETVATNFVTYGVSTATVKLGSGERLALVRDQLETLGRVNITALEQLANGQKPTVRNLPKEQGQLGKVVGVFEDLVGHRPNFKNTKEDLAWNTMMYRVRFARDLNKERVGITKFRSVFGRTPTSPLDWAAVRAWGYALR